MQLLFPRVRRSEHPDVEAALVDDPLCGFKRGDDGVFWMVRLLPLFAKSANPQCFFVVQIWEDFIRHFNKIYVCRIFGEEYNQYAIKGSWKGPSAAGAHKVFRAFYSHTSGACVLLSLKAFIVMFAGYDRDR